MKPKIAATSILILGSLIWSISVGAASAVVSSSNGITTTVQTSKISATISLKNVVNSSRRKHHPRRFRKASNSATTQILESSPKEFAVGIGYTNVVARLKLSDRFDAEARFAFGENEQAYSGRLYMRALNLGPLFVDLGAEAGYLKFDGIQSIAGDGKFGEPFIGLEFPFYRRFRITADIGPAWIDVSSQGLSVTDMVWTYNTTFYIFLF